MTAITRADSANEVAQGTRAVAVDYSDQASLVSALKGIEFLIITLALDAPQDTHRKLAEAAAKAGVRYVLTNAYGVDVYGKPGLRDDLPVGKTIVGNINHAAEVGLTWFALFTGPWYEWTLSNGLELIGIDKKNRAATFFDDGKTRINYTTIPQLVRATVALLSLKVLPDNEDDQSVTLSQFFNRPVYVSSLRLSQEDILGSIKRVMGGEDSDWRISFESSESWYEDAMKMISQGNPNGFTQAIFARAHYGTDGTYDTHNQLLGLPEEDLDEATRVALNSS